MPHGQSRSEPRILLVAPDGGLREDLVSLLGDLAPVVRPPDAADVLDLPGRLPSVRALIIVEHAGEQPALGLLQAAKARYATLAVFVLSPHPTVEHATEAIRRGAEDFVPIPYSSDLLRKEIDRALETAALRDGIANLRTLVGATYGFDQIVTSSPRMRPVLERAHAAARSDTPVLLTGETGTGKELLGRAIHANSRRREQAFVPINCAALPHDLIESELFGHRRGAFSGAHADYPGLFVSAHRGTLLLDEIGELPADAQAKLLRVLQDGEVRPVGGLESRKVDVRVIAATNRSIQEMRGGALRQDLFYRLSVLVIQVPALRERPEDIPRLAQHFLASCCATNGTGPCGIAPDAMDLLVRYAYPGNVRELENLVQSLCATASPARDSIHLDEVRAWFTRQGIRVEPPLPPGVSALPVNLRELEAWAIRSALEQAAGNKSRAATMLGISRDSLYRKLHEMGEKLSDSLTEDGTQRKHGT